MTNPYWEESPWFWEEIKERKEGGGFLFVASTGLPNYGKTYWDMAVMEDLQKDWGLPGIHDAECIVFTAAQFRRRIESCPEWHITLWDEPNKGLSNRNWYMEMNKEVTTYIQTSRFLHKPLFLALPHIKLLDKAARSVLIGEAMMKRPSLARMHQLEPDYFGNREFFKYFRGEVVEYLPNRRFREAYEEKRAEFHKADFPEEAFSEEQRIEPERSWQTVKLRILESPDRYKREVGKGTQIFRLSSRLVSYELGCSENTARRAIYEIEKDAARTGQ